MLEAYDLSGRLHLVGRSCEEEEDSGVMFYIIDNCDLCYILYSILYKISQKFVKYKARNNKL